MYLCLPLVLLAITIVNRGSVRAEKPALRYNTVRRENIRGGLWERLRHSVVLEEDI